jgi:hypothetical protein
MKKVLMVLILVIIGFGIVGCTSNSEVEKLKKENAALMHRVESLEWQEEQDHHGYHGY